MCGIVGYAGYRSAAPVLLEGLRKLEYRGYDSYGVATLAQEISIHKKAGRVSYLPDSPELLHGTIGIGHTRWATHYKGCKRRKSWSFILRNIKSHLVCVHPLRIAGSRLPSFTMVS